MNKKIILIVAVILILGGGFYLLQNSSKIETQKTVETEVSQDLEDISIELGLKISKSATDSAFMEVNLPKDSDHCEVLKKALEQGKITDLDMRYQEKYQTNGVFVINSIGKTDSPWWVYKINGSDAPLGCSQIKVAEGDKILWEYLGE